MARFNTQADFKEIVVSSPVGNASNGVLHERKFIQEPFVISTSDITNGYIELSEEPEDPTNVQMEVLGSGQQLNAGVKGLLVIQEDFEMDGISTNRLYFKTVPATPLVNEAHTLPTLPFIDGEEILVSYYYITGY